MMPADSVKRLSLKGEAQGISERNDAASPAEAEERTFTIGDLAREFGVTLRALRFYEDRGLLKPRRVGTARLYGERDRARVILILKGKQLGFTLTEIRAMLALEEGGGLKLTRDQVAEQITHLERQKAEIEAAIEELRRTHEVLAAEAA